MEEKEQSNIKYRPEMFEEKKPRFTSIPAKVIIPKLTG